MKTQTFLILVIILMVSCYTTKTVKKEVPFVPLQQVVKQIAVPWTQGLDENIAVGDPINFFNQYKIICSGNIPVHIKRYIDGKLAFKDSSVVFDYSVPKMTKGRIKNIENYGGKPISISVEFDEGGENYTHIFKVLSDKTFNLDLIVLKKLKVSVGENSSIEEPSVQLAIAGDGNGKCRLMYFPTYDSSITNTGRVAVGVPDAMGTKEIKK